MATDGGRRVLVVEDDGDAGETLRLLFLEMGFDARLAADGESAVELAREFRPSLIFMDIGLPGIDGCEAARRIRHEDGGAAMIVAMSGYGQPRMMERAAEAGMDRFLLKPANLEDLEAVLVNCKWQEGPSSH